MWPVNENTDFLLDFILEYILYPAEGCAGGDIVGAAKSGVDTVLECIEYCKTVSGCNALTWVPNDYPPGKCHVKNSNCDNHTSSDRNGIISATLLWTPVITY